VLAAAVRAAGRLTLALPAGSREVEKAFDRELRKKGYDQRVRRALLHVTPAAAARVGSLRDFLEQVQYHGRRLAKLNLTPKRALEAFDLYGRLAPRELALNGLRWAVALALDDSFYQVHAEEARAFFHLSRAELRGQPPDALTERCIAILRDAVNAEAGRWEWVECGAPAQPRYIQAGAAGEALIHETLRGRHQSYWLVPLSRDGRRVATVQFGFSAAYPWLPRELELITACAGRCLAFAERQRLVDDLRAHQEKLRSLAAHTLQVEERERRRISRELHDETGQSMMFMRMQLEVLEGELDGALAAERVRDVRRVMENTIAEVRRVIADLSPVALERFGLWAAIRRLAGRIRDTTPIQVFLAMPKRLPKPAPACEIALYRVLQESCNNVLKHASAKTLKITLKSDDKWIEMTVADDGIGFQPSAAVAKPDSYGLRGMVERVTLVEGRVSISSRAGRGARIRVRVPLPQEKSIV
jgi:signal transduction histidine kinase